MVDDTLDALKRLSAAEEFFQHLDVPYDPPVVQINRLHILKRFNQYLRTATPDVTQLEPVAQRQVCRELLLKAYGDFVRSTPAREKVFKVFQDADGASSVGLDSLRSALPSRNARAT